MELFEAKPASNAAEYTVSELSGAVAKVIEGEFGLIRVRGQVAWVQVQPEEGAERLRRAVYQSPLACGQRAPRCRWRGVWATDRCHDPCLW